MAEYKMVRLGDVCEQINGVSYKPADVYDSLTEKTTILLRANNIFEDKLNYDELVFVDKKRISENQYMKKGDILICASSGSKHLVGKAACLTEDKDLTFGAFCKVLRPKTVNPEYIKHYFFSPSYRTEISRLSEGANINNIKAADLDNLKIPLPSESIQNKIAKQLDKCVKIINNQKKALEKYDTLIKSRFIEMFGNEIVENGKYKVEKLEDVCDLITDGTHKTPNYQQKGIRFISAKNIINGKIDLTDTKFITEEEYKQIQKRCRVEKNDVLLTKSGSLGSSAIIDFDIPIGLFESLAVIKYKRNLLNGIFVKELLSAESSQKQFNNGVKGIAIKHLHLNVIAALKIPIPPIELQNDFATYVQQIDKSKFAVQKSLEKTETLYKSLMQRYFA